ncbi:MAG TPA: DUF2905 family protein [Acidobacteriota bacterium]|nr:DUF2905 family protein [Acidobacteriota bacterium]
MLTEFGKTLVWIGLLITAVGLVLLVFPSLRLGRLPGDITIEFRNGKIYIPLASSILLSVVLSLLFWFLSWLRR